MSIRRGTAAALASVLMTGMFALGGAGRADAGTVPCPSAGVVFFAIDGIAGHLHEVCKVQATVQDLGVVDTDDWRGYQQVTAASSGDTTEIFAVTGDGRLLRRGRPGPGQPFGPPTRIGEEHDWSTARTLLAAPDTVVAQLGTSPAVRVFQRTAGGLIEREPLFDTFGAPGLSGLGAGHAEINDDGRHFRVFRAPNFGGGTAEQSFFSGRLPSGLHGVTGTEFTLAGLDVDGRIVTLRQDWKSLEVPCFFNRNPWTAAATSVATGFVRLVVPGRTNPWITVTPTGVQCPEGAEPWEWQ